MHVIPLTINTHIHQSPSVNDLAQITDGSIQLYMDEDYIYPEPSAMLSDELTEALNTDLGIFLSNYGMCL